MPAVAVGAAVWGGASLVAAAATVGGIAAMGWGAIAAVGAVAAGVGVVTGNQDLIKIGGVMGLVGGVGSLASSQGLLGVAEEGPGIGASSGELASGTAEANAASSAASEPGIIGPTTTIDTGQATGFQADMDAANVVDGASAAPATPAAASPSPAAPANAPAEQGILGKSALAVPGEAGIGNSASSGWESLPGKMPYGGSGGPKGIVSSIMDFADPLLKFGKENQMLTYGLMQTGGSFIQGLFDPLAEAKKKQLEASTASYNANAAQTNAQVANMGGPAPVGSTPGGPRGPLFANNAPRMNVGLINSQVTGRPA